jgi:hypothetical protein
LAPQLAQIHEDNAMLRQRLAQEARHRLDQQVAAAVPNYREIDHDPRWHDWLLSTDALSGRQRQVLLNDAIAQGNAARVIGFFKGWQREAGTGAGDAAQQPRSRRVPMWGSDRPTYTRAQVAKVYRQHAKVRIPAAKPSGSARRPTSSQPAVRDEFKIPRRLG